MIEKDLIGEEDINFGTGTVQRRSRDGSYIAITQVNARHIPIVDTLDRFVGTTVEAALTEVLVASGAGSSAADYLNNSGASRALGTVVVVSTGADKAFTVTTSSGATNVLGVVAETIANGAVGSVVTAGFIGTVEVDAATARGSFLITSTTVGKASPVSSSQAGVFALALSATAGAGQVSALVFGVLAQDYLPLSGGNLTGTIGFFKGTDVTSASALNPFASGNKGNYFDVTATNTITSIATSGNVGTIILLHFDDALTLTHHATNLILPGAANIVTSAGDEMIFIEYASGQWRVVGYIDASTTGTGNMVRATNPVIVAPTITNATISTNAISEFTGAAGVTIDGVLLKDSLIQSESIRDTSVDYNDAGGLIQWQALWIADTAITYESAGDDPPIDFVGLTAVRLYVPTNATAIQAYVYARRTGGGSNGCRIFLHNGTTTGSATPRITSASNAWYLTEVDVTAQSGWTDFKFQIEESGTPGDTVAVTRIVFRFA